MSDPIVDEIRDIRRQIEAEHGNDPKRLLAFYMERQRELEAEGKVKFYYSESSVKDSEVVVRETPKDH